MCIRDRKTPLRVISVSGGLKDNAIPTASVALVAADAGAVQAVCAEIYCGPCGKLRYECTSEPQSIR